MALMGDLRDLSLPDLLYIFNLRAMSGRLTLQSEHDDAVLYFQRGNLVYVASSRISQHLGQLLVRLNKITPEQLGIALAMQATTHVGQHLGSILVDQGWISEEDVSTFLVHQAEEVLFRVMSWPAGTFSYTSSTTASLALPLRNLNVQHLILEATRRADEWAAIRARIPSMDCRVTLLVDPDAPISTDRLRLKARILVASISEGATTLRDVAQATGLDDAEVMRITNDLVNHGVLRVTEPSQEPAAGSANGTLRPELRDGLLASPRPPGSASLPATRS